MEYKTVPFELKQIDDAGVFWGYASIFGNVDAGGDIVERGAFHKTLEERAGKVRICHQHEWRDVIGKPLELREDEVGLFVKAQFVLDVQRAREDYALMKAGALTDLSFGYDAVKTERDKVDGQTVRRLKEIKLFEISPVTLGMNEIAGVVGVKASATPAEPEQPREEVIPISPAAAEPDDSPLTAQVATVTPSAKLELYRLLVKYGGTNERS